MDFKDRLSPKRDYYHWRILMIDDDEDDIFLVREMLSRAREGKFSVVWRSSYQLGKEMLEADRTFDAVIVDYDMGCNCGIDLIREAVTQQYPAPLLLLTGRGTYEVDIQAMEAGAADYLSKGEMNPAFLERAIRYAIERKKQEQALRKSEERYRTLFTSMLNGFALHEIILDADGKPIDYRFIEINPAFEQLTGLKAKDVIGKTVLEILPGTDPSWIVTYGKVALTGEPIQFENYFPPLEKHYQVYAFRPQQNQFAVLFSDITQRKQVEAALRESQEDLAHAQAVSHTGSWRLDIKNNALLWSDETYRIFGVPFGTALTYESFISLVHLNDRAYVDHSWTAALKGEPYDIEHRIIVDEEEKWVRERAVLELDEKGELRGGFGIVQDVTERKLAEQALREAHDCAAWLARFPDENPNPVERVSSDGRLLYQNRVAGRLRGWQCETSEYVNDILLSLIKKSRREEQMVEEDVELYGRFYAVSVVPFSKENYVNIYGRDVTKRVLAEAVLRDAKKGQ